MNKDDIMQTRPTVKGLCKLAADLGYKDPFQQLINSDGSCVGDLLTFFEDNPGAVDAVIEWAAEYHGTDEEDEEDDEEESPESAPVSE